MNPPNQQEPQNFFDARTIAAVILIVASFVGWQYYIKHRYPQAFQKDQAAAVGDNAPAPTSEASGAPATTSGAVAPGAVGQPAKLSVAPVDERFASYASDTMSFEVSSKGMGLRQLKLNQYKDRAGATVQMGLIAGGASPLETRLLGHDQPLDFTVEKVGDRRFVGHAKVGDIEVTKTLEVVPEKYLLRYHVGVRGRAAGFLGLTTFLAEELETEKRASGVFPQLDKQEFYVETVETHDRQAFAKDDVTKSWSKVKLASIGSQYFTQTILDHSPILPDLEAAVIHHDGVARASLQHHVLNADQDFVVEYDAYVGPKSYSLLRSIDPALASVVDFGFFNWIARHIFALLQWIQSLVGNWGIAIICLTLVVRLMVLPFNIYSYKSMRAMQAIQPRLQALRERYKDDTQAQQVETMKLMRENKVNPVGGCLPVLFQIPIFFALYQVLGHSIELYQAPFGLWIHDLSLKDPFYILPVLMGVTMFLQQRTTPNAGMDPAQQKVLMFMPLLFTFFMVTLPSGLTLYMWVGAVFSVAQQTYFMKSTKAPAVTGNT